MCKCLTTQVACCCCSCALNILISVIFVVLIIIALAAVAVYFGLYKPENDSEMDKVLHHVDDIKDKLKEQFSG